LLLRCRDADGNLIGTRSYFPNTVLTLGPSKDALDAWCISLQGWDRLGWNGRFVDIWMSIRDRRGPLIALVLFVAYLLVVLEGRLQYCDCGMAGNAAIAACFGCDALLYANLRSRPLFGGPLCGPCLPGANMGGNRDCLRLCACLLPIL
jgi:hypothetical protein